MSQTLLILAALPYLSRGYAENVGKHVYKALTEASVEWNGHSAAETCLYGVSRSVVEQHARHLDEEHTEALAGELLRAFHDSAVVIPADGSAVLSDVLAQLGLKHRPGRFPGRRDILLGDVVLLESATAFGVWEWLRSSGRVISATSDNK